MDPAQPYGAALAWPSTSDEPSSERAGESAARSAGQATRPRRAAGCYVVLVGSQPVLFLTRDATRITTFGGAREPRTLAAAIGALRSSLPALRKRSVRIELIDGEPALQSAYGPALQQLGLRASYRGLEL
jgi:ATP-dependent Lhr-like helicase